MTAPEPRWAGGAQDLLPALVLLATLAFATSGYLVPFDGYDDGQVPIPQTDPPVQPAGWAFAIWGLIFLWLAASAAFGLWWRRGSLSWDRVRPALLGSLVLGVGWPPLAMASAAWATVVLFAMAALAVVALVRSPRSPLPAGGPSPDRWLLREPLGLYAGWLTAASFVSLGAAGGGYGLLDPLAWAYLGLAGTAAVAGVVLLLRPDATFYAAAVIWAVVGIVAKPGQSDTWLQPLGVVAAVLPLGLAWGGAGGPRGRLG